MRPALARKNPTSSHYDVKQRQTAVSKLLLPAAKNLAKTCKFLSQKCFACLAGVIMITPGVECAVPGTVSLEHAWIYFEIKFARVAIRTQQPK